MNSIQVCLVLAASCAMLASADLASYKFGYNANDLGTVELDAPALGLVKDCDPLTSGYLVTGSTPAPLMRTAVDIEPARIMSMTPSPIISTASEFVSVSTPAPILRTAIDIEPARIIEAAPLKLESKIMASPLLSAFRPALATYDSTAWQASLENASPAPIALKTITKTANIVPTIISSGLEALPAVRTQYALATAAPHVESKIVVHNSAAPIARPLSTRILPLPSVSSSYSYAPQTYASSYLNSYTAPQYYSSASKFLTAPQYYSAAASIAPQYYSSAAATASKYYSSAASYAPQYYSSAASYAPQYYSSAASYAPQYYSSAASYAPQYYSSVASIAPQYYSSAASIAPQYYSAAPKYSSISVAADEPCDK
ncbi:uncharacterized protein LOC132951256 [Metopolophium dirhodum]|uniref:uncharacterized protein LOC132951256 n=1 Tax=Metopolophium dirhodum TaxID=44670 RepID=UPI00298F9EC6|nr:uncharacterized protein LOC132951256 [Metopolophium dirhodum]